MRPAEISHPQFPKVLRETDIWRPRYSLTWLTKKTKVVVAVVVVVAPEK